MKFYHFTLPDLFSAYNQCICTGMYVTDGMDAYVGDLFRLGDTLIVNCNSHSRKAHESLWEKDKILHLAPGDDPRSHERYFSRPTAAVIQIKNAGANQALLNYIGATPL